MVQQRFGRENLAYPLSFSSLGNDSQRFLESRIFIMSDTSSISPIPSTPARRLKGGVKAPTTAARANHSAVARSADQVDLSPDAVQLSRHFDSPSVRRDLVDRVRREIDSGAYDTTDKLDQAVQSLVRELTGPGA